MTPDGALPEPVIYDFVSQEYWRAVDDANTRTQYSFPVSEFIPSCYCPDCR